jgi:hypothetical protein
MKEGRMSATKKPRLFWRPLAAALGALGVVLAVSWAFGGGGGMGGMGGGMGGFGGFGGRGGASAAWIEQGYNDHQNMMEQLGIKSLRPGKSGSNHRK